MIRQHQRFFNMIQVSLDAISLLVAYVGAIIARQAAGDFTGYWKTYVWGSIWMVLLLLLVYYFTGVYSPMRSRPYRKEVLILTRAHLVGTIIIFSILFLNKPLEYSRQISLSFAFSGLFLILLERFIIRRTLRYFRSIC
jgi:FlaA1/EpsC-like NDP-sugar epimerase